MHDFTGAEIVRVMEGGKRVGAVLYQSGKPIFMLRENEIKQFGELLRRTGQKLGNARVTADGRIVPVGNGTVHDKDKSSYGKVFDAPAKAAPPTPVKATPVRTAADKDAQAKAAPPTATKPLLGATAAAARPTQQQPPSVRDSLRRAGFGLYVGVTEDRLLNIIFAGLEMARYGGLECVITNIKKNPAYSGKHTYYLRVDASSKLLSAKYCTIIFSAYVDGVIEIDGLYRDGDVLSFEHQGDIIFCNSAVDIRNALGWLWANCGDSTAYDRYRKEIDMLLSESRRRADKKAEGYPELTLPHTTFNNSLQNHIKDLEQIKRYLNNKFTGTYVFDWAIQGNTAALSVYKFLRDNVLSDRLLELQIALYQASGNNYVRVSYKTAATFASQGSGRWISLQEFERIEYLDDLGDAVQSVLNSVFSSGAFRAAYDVIARGILDGVPHYLVRGRPEPISEAVLLAIAEQGKIVNGLCFGISKDKKLAVSRPGLDRYGHTLAGFARLKDGRYYLQLPFVFHDSQQDAETAVKAVVPWEFYLKLSTAPRATGAALRFPALYINDMLLDSQSQYNILLSVGKELKALADKRGYGDTEKARLILDFMNCCRFVRLSDTLTGNRTAIETLVERAGCCVEQALLAAALCGFLGLPASVILRYSPALLTRFHAVTGVRLSSFSGAEALEFCRNNASFSCVSLGEYVGLEVSSTKNKPIGVAEFWSTGGNAHKSPSQTVFVLLSPDLKKVAAYTQITQEAGKVVVTLTQDLWQKILCWFSARK